MPRPPKQVMELRRQLAAQAETLNNTRKALHDTMDRETNLRRDLDGATKHIDQLKKWATKRDNELAKLRLINDKLETKLDKTARIFADMAIAYDEDRREQDERSLMVDTSGTTIGSMLQSLFNRKADN